MRDHVEELFSNAIKELNEKGKILSSTSLALIMLSRAEELVSRAGVNSLWYLAEYLDRVTKVRSSAILLHNIVREFLKRSNYYLEEAKEGSVDKVVQEIVKLRRKVINSLQALSAIASKRIENGDVIMTHGYSTSVFMTLKAAIKEGKDIKVYISESRPFSNGITMAENLEKLGIEVTLFVDSAMRYFMKGVNKVLLGAEAVTANGAVVGKVGSSLLSLVAHEARVRVLIISSIMKFSPETFFGELIEEERTTPNVMFSRSTIAELRKLGVKFYVPVLDFTPPEYIDLIVTERGIIAPQAVPFVVQELYGWPPEIFDVNELLREFKLKVKEVVMK